MSVEEVVKKAEEAVRAGATELRIVGGHNPAWNTSKKCFSEIKSRFPNVVIKALTARKFISSPKLEKC